MQNLTILGATGSIGASTLDVVARHPDRYRVHALTANTQVDKLAALCARYRPDVAVVGTAAAADALAAQLRHHGVATAVAWGPQALVDVAAAAAVEVVMAAIVGAAGLPPTLAAARAGKRVLLANKEALVVAGALFIRAAADGGAALLPIDSEHNALYQCLPPGGTLQPGVAKLTLTASGGPFRTRALKTLAQVTPAEACAHPNWVMGRKISVDSATMMNKGLEVIEAHWLFAAPASAIDVLIHPQSIVHSMVSYDDGSVLAQLGNPDMRTPIAYGLAWPQRIDAGVAPLDLSRLSGLTFEQPDYARFPCLRLAFDAMIAGAGAPVVLNAANEVAVDAFLAGRIRFTEIAAVVADALAQWPGGAVDTIDAVLGIDARARALARERIARRT